MQVPDDAAPMLDEKVPAPQSLHAASPVAALNLPATQREQGPPLLPVAPALQAQAVEAALAAGESECVGQAEQVPDDAEPMLGEKVPAPQSLHVALPAAALNLPATH